MNKLLKEKLYEHGNYLQLQRNLVHNLGIKEAIVYTELGGMCAHWSEMEKLTDDGCFFCTTDALFRKTSLSEGQQKRTIDKLVEKGLIEVFYRGLPKRRYFKIVDDTEKINKIFAEPVFKNAEKEPFPEELKKFNREKFYKLLDEITDDENIKDLYDAAFEILGEPMYPLSRRSIENVCETYDYLEYEEKELLNDNKRHMLRSFKNSPAKNKNLNVFMSDSWLNIYITRDNLSEKF